MAKRLSLIERAQVKRFIKILLEARDTTYAEYEVKKNKVIANISKQKAAAFTKLADEWKKFETLEQELREEKRKLSEKVDAAKQTEEKLKDKIREKVAGIFDDSEQAMTLTVNCLNSCFTLSELASKNLPRTVAKAGDIISTDYKQVVELLIEQNKDLQDTINLLIRQCSTIAVEDIVKPGDKRGVRITTSESLLRESLWDNIVRIYNKIAAKIKGYFSKLKTRQSTIDEKIMLLKGK